MKAKESEFSFDRTSRVELQFNCDRERRNWMFSRSRTFRLRWLLTIHIMIRIVFSTMKIPIPLMTKDVIIGLFLTNLITLKLLRLKSAKVWSSVNSVQYFSLLLVSKYWSWIFSLDSKHAWRDEVQLLCRFWQSTTFDVHSDKLS